MLEIKYVILQCRAIGVASERAAEADAIPTDRHYRYTEQMARRESKRLTVDIRIIGNVRLVQLWLLIFESFAVFL